MSTKRMCCDLGFSNSKRLATSPSGEAPSSSADSMESLDKDRDVPDVSRPVPSVAGLELSARFVDSDEINRQYDYDTTWYHAEDMEAYAAELINLHRDSLEMEQLLVTGAVPAKSSNGLVEHLGIGVLMERNTIPVDLDSRKNNPQTITRPEMRSFGRLCIDTVVKELKVVGVDQSGIGKTRGTLTYTLQELLWRGEAVMRVGYKNMKTYLFLPAADGTYKVWRTHSETWRKSELAKDERVFALIDPPEQNGGNYKDSADCHVIKFASNNSERHYHNFHKDGLLLITAMPTEDEVVAMIPVLWSNKISPTSGKQFDTDESKVDEIKQRMKFVGCMPRYLFYYKYFIANCKSIVTTAQNAGMALPLEKLKGYYEGTSANAEKDPSSVSSLLFFINPANMEDRDIDVFVTLNPVAALVLGSRIKEIVSCYDGKRAFQFEDDVCTLMIKGGKVDGVVLRVRTRFKPANTAATSEAIIELRDDHNRFVVAYTNYPILDFATSIYDWCNAKVGDSKPEVKSGAFITLMVEHLGLAEEVVGDGTGSGLRLVEDHCDARITLTMMRNISWKQYAFINQNGDNNKQYNFERVKAFFEQHVTVKFLNVANWQPPVGDETADIMKSYGIAQ